MKKASRLWSLKSVERFLVRLCETRPGVYTAGYLCSFFLLLAAGEAAPFITRSIVYPVCTQQSRERGTIEEVVKEEEKTYIFGSHGRGNTYFRYQFVVDGLPVRVTPEDYRNYEKGDLYSYYLYRRNGKSIGDYHDYSLGQGVLLSMLVILAFLVSLAFIFTETSEKELEKKAEFDRIGQKPPQRPRFEPYSTKELYEQCLAEGIRVGKAKSRNRKYLMNCLMGIHETKVYHYRSMLKEKKQRKVADGIFAVLVLVMVVNYMRHVFYLFYLFFR